MRLPSLVNCIAFVFCLGLCSPVLASTVKLSVFLRNQPLTLELSETQAFDTLKLVNLPHRSASAHYFEGGVAASTSSWVRASLINGNWSGVVFLNNALYQFHFLAAQLNAGSDPYSGLENTSRISEISLKQIDGSVIRKLFSHGNLRQDFSTSALAESNQLTKRTSAELIGINRNTVLGGSVGNELIRLDLELFLDYHFVDYANSLQLNPADTAVAMVNIIDGIYRTDLGIRFNLVGISADTAAFPVLSETVDAETLLNDLENKKNANLVFSQGDNKLGHLITSRSRDAGLYLDSYPGVIGLAYSRGDLIEAPVLCSASALGLSLAYLPVNESAQSLASLTALTMAHEIAHNLGAIHDGRTEAGYTSNACDASKYIMSAQENSATHFSECSKQEIADEIDRVRQSVQIGQVQNCMVDLVDLDLVLTNSFSQYQSLNGVSQREFSLLNHSNLRVDQIGFSGEISNQLAKFVSVNASNASCSLDDDYHYHCTVPTMAALSQVNVVEKIEYLELGTLSISNQIDTFSSAVGSEDIDTEDLLRSSVSVLDLIAPAAPSEVTAKRVNGGVKIEWKDNSDVEEGFLLERQINDDSFAVVSSSIAANSTSYIDSTANDTNAEYVYRVSAVNRIGSSAAAESSALHAVKHSGSGGGALNVIFISVACIFLLLRCRNLCELGH